jgi:hypothetical protein
MQKDTTITFSIEDLEKLIFEIGDTLSLSKTKPPNDIDCRTSSLTLIELSMRNDLYSFPPTRWVFDECSS